MTPQQREGWPLHADELRSRHEDDALLASELGIDIERVSALPQHPFALSDATLMRELDLEFDQAAAPLNNRNFRRTIRRRIAGMRRRLIAIPSVLDNAVRRTRARIPRDTPASRQWLEAEKRSPDALRKRFAEDGDPETLLALLRAMFDVEGHLTATLNLANGHTDLLATLGPRAAAFRARLDGAARLSRTTSLIPPRSYGAVFTPEHDRLMYCVAYTPAYHSNGYATRTMGVVEGLRDRGHEVIVTARSGYPWDSSPQHRRMKRSRITKTINGIPYVHTPGSAIAATPLDAYIMEAADTFTREARRIRPSLIQSASNFRTAMPALIAARRVGVPFVYEVRGLWEVTAASTTPAFDGSERYSAMARLEALVASEADSVVALSEQIADELVRRGVVRSRILIAPNAVDPVAFGSRARDEAFAAEHDIDSQVPTIGFAGSMAEYEGLETLCDASAILADRGVNHRVVVAGSGAAEASIRERVSAGAAKVSLLGRLPMGDIPRLLSVVDLVAVPRLSLPVTEMVPALKPLEALGAGKATVLSDVAPHRTIAGDDQRRAALAVPGDATSLADVLQQLIENPKQRSAIASAGRSWVEQHRSWMHVASIMESAFAAAKSHHTTALEQSPNLPLAELRIAATHANRWAQHSGATIEMLNASSWREILKDNRPHAVMVCLGVEAWPAQELIELADYCRDAAVPTIGLLSGPTHESDHTMMLSVFDAIVTDDADAVASTLAAGGRAVLSANPGAAYQSADVAADSNPLPYVAVPDSDAPLTARQRNLRDVAAAVVGIRGVVAGHIASSTAQIDFHRNSTSPSGFPAEALSAAASGVPVLVDYGDGADALFNGVIPATSNSFVWRALLNAWRTDPSLRQAEVCLQLRAVHRSQLRSMSTVTVLRAAGVPVSFTAMPRYGVRLTTISDELVTALVAQSVRPALALADGLTPSQQQQLAHAGIAVKRANTSQPAELVWLGDLSEPKPRTHFEDLLIRARFGPTTPQVGATDR